MAGGDQEILVGSDLYIYADKTEITEGDSIEFTVRPIALGEDVITIYVNNVSVYSTQNPGSDISYVHIFNESGEFSVYAEATYNNIQTQPIVVTVEEDNITLPTSQVSWEINNKNVQSIFIDNKEVQSIVVEDSGDILFQKSNDIINLPIMELEITKNSFSTYSSNPFTYNGKVFVDWGDDTGLIEYTGGRLAHTYSSSDTYTIKIYGDITSLRNSCFWRCTGLTSIIIPDSVTSLGASCFTDCTDLTSIIIPDSVTSLGGSCFSYCSGLTSIIIPDSVTSLGDSCFYDCSGLTSIILNWITNDEIITYNQKWITNTSSNLLFYVPNGTTSLYTAKEYPLEKLEEMYDEIELTTDKSILSYADNETCTLTAQLLKESTPFMVGGITVEFFNGSTSMGTAQTNSNGIATMTYSSSGVGDVIFYATKNNKSNTITIEDCLYYSSPASTNAIIAPWTDNCTIEYEVYAIDTWNWQYLLVFQEENQEHIATLSSSYDNSSRAPIKTTNFPPPNTWTPMQFKTENGTATVSSNGTVKGTTNISLSDLTSIKIYNSKSNTQQRNVKIKPLNSISLVVSQSILSYADSDSTTLTATHSLGTGKTIKLYNASDDSLIGVMTDNEDGTYSYTYNGQGIGDLSVYASDGNIISEDILIEDCIYYTGFTSHDSSHWGIVSGNTPSFKSDGGITITSGMKYCLMDTLPSDGYVVELEHIEYNSSFPFRICWFSSSYNYSDSYAETYSKSGRNYWGVLGGVSNQGTPVTGDIFKVEVRSDGTNFIKNDVSLSTGSTNLIGRLFGFYGDSNISQSWKNLKIKPLGA